MPSNQKDRELWCMSVQLVQTTVQQPVGLMALPFNKWLLLASSTHRTSSESDLSTQNKEMWSKALSQLHSQRAEMHTVPDPSPILRFLCLERKVARGKIYIDSWVTINVFARRLWSWKTGGLVTKRSGKWGHGLKSQRRSKISDYALVLWIFTKEGLHGRQRI